MEKFGRVGQLSSVKLRLHVGGAIEYNNKINIIRHKYFSCGSPKRNTLYIIRSAICSDKTEMCFAFLAKIGTDFIIIVIQF